MRTAWSDEDKSCVHEMWTCGLTDADIAKRLAPIGREATVDAVRQLRERNGWVALLPGRQATMASSEPELTHEIRVRCDEAFVDAMIAAGYLPSDPVAVRDGRVMWRHQSAPAMFGSSALA